MATNQKIMPMLFIRDMNLYPTSKNEGILSSIPPMRDLKSKKSYMKIYDRRANKSLTTSAKFTSKVKTCSITSGVRTREINGNTFEFINRSLMWLANSITITIIAKTVITKISVISES